MADATHATRPNDEKIGAMFLSFIVMGTHGLSGTRKLFFGSTTQQIIRRADVPILAVPHLRSGRRGQRSARSRSSWPGKIVLAPTDLAEDALVQAKATSDLAYRFGARVLFVHVVEPTHCPGWLKTRSTVRAESAGGCSPEAPQTSGLG